MAPIKVTFKTVQGNKFELDLDSGDKVSDFIWTERCLSAPLQPWHIGKAPQSELDAMLKCGCAM